MMTHMSMSLIMMTMRTLSESFYSFTTIIRVSSHSYIPDLETQQQQMHLHQQTSGPGFESSRIYQHHQPSPPNHLSESVLEPAPPTSLVIKTALIEPHPQVVAKKKESGSNCCSCRFFASVFSCISKPKFSDEDEVL